MSETARKQKLSHILVLLCLFALQSLNLDCDPSPVRRINDFNDEGFWSHSARSKTLFGTFLPDEFNQGVVVAPLFTFFQWISFSVAGVSTHSARILPLVSLWLILLMVYALVKRQTSANMGLLAALMLGVLHELLMFMKWGTPILPETCFLLAVYFFWSLRDRGRWWVAASAAAFVAATLTTALAMHCLSGILLFLAIAYFIRKDAAWSDLVRFAASGVVLGLIVAVVYYLPIRDQVKIFLATVGKENFEIGSYVYCISGPSVMPPETRFAAPFFEPFGSPGTSAMMMLLSMWLIDVVLRLWKDGVMPVLRQMSSLELYCVCWCIGALPSILMTPYMPPRRFIMFFTPMAVIASLFIWRAWTCRSDETSPAPPASYLPTGIGRILLWCAIVAAWYEYINRSLIILQTRWLMRAGYDFVSTPTGMVAVVCIGGAIVAIVSGQYFLRRKTRPVIAALVVCFAVCNVALDGIWCAKATFTIRDESRLLGRITQPGQYICDSWAWQFSMDNQLLPIYSPWFFYGDRINAWFLEESQRREFILVRNLEFEGMPLWYAKVDYNFPANRVSLWREIEICPVVFSKDQYRYHGRFYMVSPPSKDAPKKPVPKANRIL